MERTEMLIYIVIFVIAVILVLKYRKSDRKS